MSLGNDEQEWRKEGGQDKVGQSAQCIHLWHTMHKVALALGTALTAPRLSEWLSPWLVCFRLLHLVHCNCLVRTHVGPSFVAQAG